MEETNFALSRAAIALLVSGALCLRHLLNAGIPFGLNLCRWVMCCYSLFNRQFFLPFSFSGMHPLIQVNTGSSPALSFYVIVAATISQLLGLDELVSKIQSRRLIPGRSQEAIVQVAA